MLTVETLGVLGRLILASDRREICGFLLIGASGAQEFRAVNNLERWPDSFLVSDVATGRIHRDAERLGLRVAAFVHSHPIGVELSDLDAIGMKASAIPWIVVTLGSSGVHFKVHTSQATEASR